MTATLKNTRNFLFNNIVLVVFFFMIIFAGFSSRNFYTYTNIINILNQVSYLGIIACGMLFVILTSGIDLSVGSILALSSIIIAVNLENLGHSLPYSILLAVFAGAAAGLISGFLVAKANIAPFVVTLAMMTIGRGVALIISKGRPILVSNDFLANFALMGVLGIPAPVIVLAVFVVFSWFILQKTVIGRIIIAIGSNETATEYAGIKVSLYKIFVYVYSGIACGISSIILVSRTGVGSPILGEGLELDTIAAVVIGGASLAGGKGKVLNTVLGALILGIISNIMNLLGIPGYNQRVVKGLIILAAVLAESLKSKKSN